MKNIFKSLSILSIVFLFGCPSAKDIANGIAQSLDKEEAFYENMVKNKGIRGNNAGEMLLSWVRALEEASNGVGSVVIKLKAKPEQRADVEFDLQELRKRLDKVFARESTVMIPSLPPWYESNAVNAGTKFKVIMRDLRSNYNALFGAEPANSNDKTWTIGWNLDRGLYDTLTDCYNQFAFFGAGSDDKANCDAEAKVFCTHQTDIPCLSVMFMRHADGNGCSSYMKNADGKNVRFRANWLNAEVSACYRNDGIFK